VFAGAFTVVAGLIFAFVQIASHGRFTENLVVLTLAGVGGGVGPNQLLYQMSLYSRPSGCSCRSQWSKC
jgi:hypothetical protein